MDSEIRAKVWPTSNYGEGFVNKGVFDERGYTENTKGTADASKYRRKNVISALLLCAKGLKPYEENAADACLPVGRGAFQHPC